MAILLVLSVLAALALAQRPPPVPNSFPQAYPGQPFGDYSTDWQAYFEVTDPLPNVTDALPRSFAGSISVNRANHPNNTLFFWGFESQSGSLTAAANQSSSQPWLIWLNGGPGASSLLGLMTENGPLSVTNTFDIVQNPSGWNQLVDTIWVDQPVGTGFSTSDSTGYIANEDQMGVDFLNFLSNLVQVFPSLALRPLYLTGESYAGVYIPYIAKALFSTPNPPVQLAKIAIGDGAIGSLSVFEELPTLSIIETYPQIINYDQDVFQYFKTQEHLCGYDLNLTYPQSGPFPTLAIKNSKNASKAFFQPGQFSLRSDSFQSVIAQRHAARLRAEGRSTAETLSKRHIAAREESRQRWKRDLAGRPNGTIDPFYGCFLLDEMLDYAANFSFPWSNGAFDVYDIPDALNPDAPSDPSVFLNDNGTRTALHAPQSKNWTANFNYPFNSSFKPAAGANEFGDPSVEPMAFFSELAANASAHDVTIIIYSGNDDSLVAHRGSEVVIQNTTFGGIQGFTRKPSTPWFDDDENFAGIIHQERGLVYALFANAGHMVPRFAPKAALTFVREFIVDSNSTGLVTPTLAGAQAVVGGENATFADGVMPGANAIFYGSGTTAFSTVAPPATAAAWASFLATATATTAPTTSATASAAARARAAPGWAVSFASLAVLLSAAVLRSL